ncbi:MAG: rhomboid family intramembrane serine protease [Flavobacteriales bacterium]|nr:rhomboid family intramembrane serine protease [Flavobacteriales bacterium]
MVINASVFALINLVLLFAFFDQGGKSFLHRIPEDLTLAASSSPYGMLLRPWSLITHMFAHIQFGHFLFNMIALYTMGQVFVSVRGSKPLVAVYVMGGLSGYLLFALAFNFIPAFASRFESYVLGASAAVMAVTTAAATLKPRQHIFLFGAIRLELRWLAVILVLLDLASVRTGVNSGGHIGHLGGAFFGYFYATQLLKGKDMGSWFSKMIDKISSFFNRRRMRVVTNNGRPKSDEQFNIEKKQRQKRIDEILDKISRSGYDSLTKEEKEFLFRNSQK